jgi:hypothetical protein
MGIVNFIAIILQRLTFARSMPRKGICGVNKY